MLPVAVRSSLGAESSRDVWPNGSHAIKQLDAPAAQPNVINTTEPQRGVVVHTAWSERGAISTAPVRDVRGSKLADMCP